MILSIDIGTSYSSVSIIGQDMQVHSIDTNTGVSMYGSKYSLPTAVFAEDDGRLIIGQAAMNSRMRNPQNFRDEFKRNLGESIPILLGKRSFLPDDFYVEFYRHMKSCAEKVCGQEIECTYLTYPASYGKNKKERIVAAAKAAGLFNVELVDEPTAAAMSYCAEGFVQDRQNLLIYDFGGGTFDVSLIRFENGEFHQLTDALGMERCGGIDIDRLIFWDMLSKVPAETIAMLQMNNMHYMRFMSQLSELAVKCKHHLSSADNFSDQIMVGFDSVPYSLSLEQYNQMVAGLVGQTIQTCRQIIENAKLKVSDLNAVLLVGGTSRVRLVREMVEQMAGKVPVLCAADLELAVSQGALNYRNYKKSDTEPILDAEVWYQMGTQYEDENKPEKAFSCYIKAAEMGNIHGQYALAECYQSGYGTNKDDKQAFAWYTKAANSGDADSQFLAGQCLLMGLGVQQNEDQARYWLSKAAQQGQEKAAAELKKLDDQRSVEEHCASHNSREVSDLIGILNVRNAQIQQDTSVMTMTTDAEGFLKKGNKYYAEKDYGRALECYLNAAELGSSAAQFKLGEFFSSGMHVKQDQAEAVKWYTRAANQNNSIAQFRLATCHYNALGTVKDEQVAMRVLDALANDEKADWYFQTKAIRYLQYLRKKNAENYPVDKIMGLAREFKQDKWYSLALECYMKAGHAGNAAAQYEIAEAYHYGRGIAKSETMADIWYRKAAEQGHQSAIAKVGVIPKSNTATRTSTTSHRQRGVLEAALDWILGI